MTEMRKLSILYIHGMGGGIDSRIPSVLKADLGKSLPEGVVADAALLLLAALTAGVQALHFASQQITLIGARHGAVVVFHRVDYSRRRLGHVAVFAAPNAGALCVWLRQRRAAIKAFFKRGAVPAPALGTFQGMILLDSKSETYRYSTPYVKIPAI